MSRAIDLFVTYRFLKLLVTPWKKQEAYKQGIIDDKGKALKKARDLTTEAERESFTLLHRLVFNCKRIMGKIPFVRSQLGTYATAFFLLKEHYKIENLPEGEINQFLMENKLVSFDNKISEEVIGFGEVLPKGEYVLVNDILNKEEEELSAKKGDKVIAYDDEPPVDTILGVEIFPVIHVNTQEKIYVSLEDIKNG